MFNQETMLYQPQVLNREGFELLLVRFSQKDRARVMFAYDRVKEWHRGQWRRDGGRYFEHPKAVAAILLMLGITDADTIIAALCHDVKEDCSVTLEQIESEFGTAVARIVDLVSKEAGPGFSEDVYFATLTASGEPRAWLVKLADRLHNLATLTLDPDRIEWCNTKKIEQVEETRAKVLPLAVKLCATRGYRSYGKWFRTQLDLWCVQRWAEVYG